MMGINSPRLLIAEVVVEGQTFSGSGPSKAIAKNVAAEAAVHYVVMQRNKEEPPEDGGGSKTPLHGELWLVWVCCMLVRLMLIVLVLRLQLCSNFSMTGSLEDLHSQQICALRNWKARCP